VRNPSPLAQGVCKQDLCVSPLYLHTDERIEAMLLLMHMLALLTYNLLERQARRHGLALTSRRIIAVLESLTISQGVYTHRDALLGWLGPGTPGAHVWRAAPTAEGAEIVDQMPWPHLRLTLPPLRRSKGPPSFGC
jgi:hypothetical protein